MRWPYLRMNYPNPKDLKVPKALKDSIKPSSQTLNPKKQKAVITTAFLFFNLKSNTMKKHSANIAIIPLKHSCPLGVHLRLMN